jgi:aminoglycoside phosphotransferase family enzyme
MTNGDGSSISGRTSAAPSEPSIEDKVRFLEDPCSYPHNPGSVRVEETHMSWVFLAGSHVYKLKKPVHYPFLDFSTLAAREHFVREEVRLNRRLAPEIYLAATPLSLDTAGHLSIGPGDRVVDWLVTMQRLPEDRMLDRLIAEGSLTPPMVGQLADVLTGFFKTASPEKASPDHYAERYLREQAQTASVLLDPAFQFDGARVEAALGHFDSAFEVARPLLDARVRAGRIVEGHGDLRPEHVCMTDPIAIIDCLEFNRDLRLADPFEELAFLGLECARFGADWVFPALYRRCAEGLDDRPSETLIQFYWTYRALLRARLSLVHLMEPNPRTPEKWRPLAWRYIALSERSDLIRSGPSAR